MATAGSFRAALGFVLRWSFFTASLGSLAFAQHQVRPPGAGQSSHDAPDPVWIPVDDPGGAGITTPGALRSRAILDDIFLPFPRTLGKRDAFGGSLSIVGDLNGDGRQELAIGAPRDYFERGAVWLFSMLPDRKIDAFVKLGPVEQLLLPLANDDRFGSSVAALGDLDGDGIVDLAVGAQGADDGLLPPFGNAGAVHILFLNFNGTIREQVKISNTAGGLSEPLDNGDFFGASLAPLGDFDGDGVEDLVVGTPGDDDGGSNRGALWILYLRSDGSVRSQRRISQTRGGFGGALENLDGFGTSLACIGDLDGDGVKELAVGTPDSDDGGLDRGAAWILFLRADGTVRTQQKLSSTKGGLGVLTDRHFFGTSLAALGDLDGDGVEDLACGDAPPERFIFSPPIVQLLFLKADGTVRSLSQQMGPINEEFGAALASADDLDGDGRTDLVVGSPGADARALDSGGLKFYNLEPSGAVSGAVRSVDASTSGLPIAPAFYFSDDRYGKGIAPLGDIDDDGFPEVAVGAPFDDDGAVDAGAVWIHYIKGSVEERRTEKISNTQGNLMVTLPASHNFGRALAYLGFLDANGIGDLAVGARETVWILFLLSNGSVQGVQRIDAPLGGTDFGAALAPLGDLDGDGVLELAVGAPGDSQFGHEAGAIWLLHLRTDGTVASQTKIPSPGPAGGVFGFSLANLGDLDRDGVDELAVGAPGGFSGTSVWILFLRRDGTLRSSQRYTGNGFGSAVASPGDLDGDGIGEAAWPIPRSGQDSLRISFLRADGSIKSGRDLSAGRNLFGLGTLGDLTGDGVPDLGAATSFGPGSRVYLLELSGFAHVGFEHTDNLDAQPLVNGRAIPMPHPGRTFVISSSGANLGAAIFDSTPGGPNDPSQDLDLLVMSRNVLMLQDSLHPTQSIPGIYDEPNDDRDGGSLTLDFPGRLIRPLSIKLIDIDRGANQGATVELTDDAGRLRIYTAPDGWTEDVHNDGPPGFRILDLTLLTPQPGFVSTATATETPGFAASHVVRIEVQLGSSGAIDDFVYDPHP